MKRDTFSFWQLPPFHVMSHKFCFFSILQCVQFVPFSHNSSFLRSTIYFMDRRIFETNRALSQKVKGQIIWEWWRTNTHQVAICKGDRISMHKCCVSSMALCQLSILHDLFFIHPRLNYRLITANLILRVNCDKIMHARWDFEVSDTWTKRVKALRQAMKLKRKCIILSQFLSTQLLTHGMN